MQLHPDHLIGICTRLEPTNQIFPFLCDDHAPGYQLRCECGREEFEVWKSDRPGVYARCSQCHSILIVYDLRLYPAATYVARPDLHALVALSCGCNRLQTYAAYEYSAAEDDVPFNPNDIALCHIWCRCRLHQTVQEIVDDETA